MAGRPMMRLLALGAAGFVLFAGFGAMFYLGGIVGFVVALSLITLGSALLWYVEHKTAHHLEGESLLNKILNTNDGGPK